MGGAGSRRFGRVMIQLLSRVVAKQAFATFGVEKLPEINSLYTFLLLNVKGIKGLVKRDRNTDSIQKIQTCVFCLC